MRVFVFRLDPAGSSHGSGKGCARPSAVAGSAGLWNRDAVLAACRAHSIRQQAGDGHRPDPARHRRDRARHVACFVEGDIADQAVLAAVLRYSVDADIDFAQLVKLYGTAPDAEKRYSSPVCVGARKERFTGNPDRRHISTSHVERSNLSFRMHMRRYTRLTNAHSKKFENHCHMVALYTVWYNFVRTHSSVRMPPAMAAGVAKSPWDMADIVKLIDAAAPKPGPRGPYKKDISN